MVMPPIFTANPPKGHTPHPPPVEDDTEDVNALGKVDKTREMVKKQGDVWSAMEPSNVLAGAH